MHTIPMTEEYKSQPKSEKKLVRSPPHIFDNNKLDLNSNTRDSIIEREEKTVSLEFQVDDSEIYSIEYENGIFCMKWSPDGQYLAVGCADGGVRILRGSDGKLAYRLKTSG